MIRAMFNFALMTSVITVVVAIIVFPISYLIWYLKTKRLKKLIPNKFQGGYNKQNEENRITGDRRGGRGGREFGDGRTGSRTKKDKGRTSSDEVKKDVRESRRVQLSDDNDVELYKPRALRSE